MDVKGDVRQKEGRKSDRRDVTYVPDAFFHKSPDFLPYLRILLFGKTLVRILEPLGRFWELLFTILFILIIIPLKIMQFQIEIVAMIVKMQG